MIDRYEITELLGQATRFDGVGNAGKIAAASAFGTMIRAFFFG